MERSVGVVIRTKNESRWIRFCLTSLYKQKGIDSLSIVLVDCDSSDFTVNKARTVYPNLKIIKYQGEYFPGNAINLGVEQLENINYLVVLSAHCIPIGTDWLYKLIQPLEKDNSIAGSYCRQIPTPASSPENRRDLLNTFSIESRTQTIDSFFHNAASILRFKCWRDCPFDSSLKHIEDRYWAKSIIKKGWKIHYNAQCSVVHEHGVNQHSNVYRSFRGEGVSSLLEESELSSSWLEFAQKETHVLILILASKMPKHKDIERLRAGNSKTSILIVPKLGITIDNNSEFLLERDPNWNDVSLYELMKEILLKKISTNEFFEYIYFIDDDKINSTTKTPHQYVFHSYISGADMCVKVKSYKEDFFMLEPNEISWKPLSNKLMNRYDNKPHFKRALYGHGALLRSDDLLQSKVPKVIFFDE